MKYEFKIGNTSARLSTRILMTQLYILHSVPVFDQAPVLLRLTTSRRPGKSAKDSA